MAELKCGSRSPCFKFIAVSNVLHGILKQHRTRGKSFARLFWRNVANSALRNALETHSCMLRGPAQPQPAIQSQFSLSDMHAVLKLYSREHPKVQRNQREGSRRCLEVVVECSVARKIKLIGATWGEGRRRWKAVGVKEGWPVCYFRVSQSFPVLCSSFFLSKDHFEFACRVPF